MTETHKLKAQNILFLAEEKNSELFKILSGQVLVFVQKGSEIIPLAYLREGEYIGELSFFDEAPRSASIICLEDSEFIKLDSPEIKAQLPGWLKILGKQLCQKIRDGDELIRAKGIRKKNTESIKPLEIPEQARIFKIVDEYKKQKR